MDKIIKGFPFWHEKVNDNFDILENNINDITEITNSISHVTTQLNFTRSDFIIGSTLTLMTKNYSDSIKNQPNFENKLANSGLNMIPVCVYVKYQNGNLTLGNDNAMSINDIVPYYDIINRCGIDFALKIHTYIPELSDIATKDVIFPKINTLITQLLTQFPKTKLITVLNEVPHITSNIAFTNDVQTLINTVKGINPNIMVGLSSIAIEYLYKQSNHYTNVDFLGINCYPSSSKNNVSTFEENKKNIRKLGDMSISKFMNDLYTQYNRKYLITEIGIPHYEGSCIAPEQWDIDTVNTPISKTNQIYYLQNAYMNYVKDINCMGVWLFDIDVSGGQYNWFYDDEIYNEVSKVLRGDIYV